MLGQSGSSDDALREALQFQSRVLGGVSRTFALTIPTLPPKLRVPVVNAYLLCRIADTIEDDPVLPVADKRTMAERFVEVLERRAPAAPFAAETVARLAPDTSADERELIAGTERVVRVTHSLGDRERRALIRCVGLMSGGMHRFQNRAGLQGLPSMRALDEYCFFVAGIVGEMLTELFCAHAPRIGARRERLLALAPSFGQGLQMTNILKDVWDDRARGICWLPRPVFGLPPADRGDLLAEADNEAVRQGVRELAVVAHGHLRNALDYTLLIPRRYHGIRRFCLWALGMAVPTLANIHSRPGFRSAAEVKITRPQVRAIVRRYGLLSANDTALRWLFRRASSRLPASDPGVASGLGEISRRASAGNDAHPSTARRPEPAPVDERMKGRPVT